MAEYRSSHAARTTGGRHRMGNRRPTLVDIFRRVIYVGLGGE